MLLYPSCLVLAAWQQWQGSSAPAHMCQQTCTLTLSLFAAPLGEGGKCHIFAVAFFIMDDSCYSIEKPYYSLEVLVVKRNFTDCGTGFYPFKNDRTFPSGRIIFSSLWLFLLKNSISSALFASLDHRTPLPFTPWVKWFVAVLKSEWLWQASFSWNKPHFCWSEWNWNSKWAWEGLVSQANKMS